MRQSVLVIVPVLASAFLSLLGCGHVYSRNAESDRVMSGYQLPAPHSEGRARVERLRPEGDTELADNDFRVEVLAFDRSVPLQQNPRWCWAACAEAIHRHHAAGARGRTKVYTRDALVLAMAPHEQDQAMDAINAILALTPDLWDDHAKASACYAENEPTRRGGTRPIALCRTCQRFPAFRSWSRSSRWAGRPLSDCAGGKARAGTWCWHSRRGTAARR